MTCARKTPAPVILALLGPDGCGKTALIQALHARWGAAVHYCHLRPRLGQRIHALGQAPPEPPHGKPPRGALLSVLKLAYFWLDITLGLWWLRRRYRAATPGARPALIVFDRYLHDMPIDPQRYRYGGPAGLLAWLTRQIPTPDVMLVLDAPPEVLQARKQELSPDACTALRARYRAFIAAYPGGHCVDAAQPLAEVAANTLAILEAALADGPVGALSAPAPQNHEAMAPLHAFWQARGVATASWGSGPPVYWALYRPDGSPRWILPCQPRGAACEALARWRPASRLARAGWWAFRVGYRLGVLGLCPPGLRTSWARIQPVRALASQNALPQSVMPSKGVAFYVGTPCHSQKWLAFEPDPQTGTLARILKWPVAPGAPKLIAQERAALQALAAWPAGQPPLAPHLLPVRDGDPPDVLCLSSLSGTPTGERLSTAHRAFLQRLSLPGSTLSRAEECERLRRGFSHWQGLSSAQAALIDTTLTRLADPTPWPAVRAHGDFAPWNLLRQPDGRLAAVDWEWSRAPALPLHDACYFYAIQSLTLGRPRDALAALRADPIVAALQGEMRQATGSALRQASPAAESAYLAAVYALTLLHMALSQHEDGNTQARPVLDWVLGELAAMEAAAL